MTWPNHRLAVINTIVSSLVDDKIVTKRISADRHDAGDADLFSDSGPRLQHCAQARVFGLERRVSLQSGVGEQAFGLEPAVLQTEFIAACAGLANQAPHGDWCVDDDTQRMDRNIDGFVHGVKVIFTVVDNQNQNAEAGKQQQTQAQGRRSLRSMLIICSCVEH
jgi:hypothetical protein